MSTTAALLIVTAITVVVFHALDWLCWGTAYARRRILPAIPKELWRFPVYGGDADRAASGRSTVLLGALVTTWSGIMFTPLVWVLGPQLIGVRGVLVAALMWAALLAPMAWATCASYRIPMVAMRWQAFSMFLRVLAGLLIATTLFPVLDAW